MMIDDPFALPSCSVSYLIVLCVVAVETVSMVVLWTALRASIPRVFRPLVAAVGLSGAWGAWILVLVLHGPLSMLALTGSAFAVASVVMGVAIHLATVEADADDGSDGGSPTISAEGPGGSGGDEPIWWPEFQRQLDEYTAERDRERQPVDC